MTVLKVREYPDPVLKVKAQEVEKVDNEIRKFLDDMLETMYAAEGVGLAAPQVGVSKRIVVIDISHDDENRMKPLYMVNPKIVWHSEEKVCGTEGCLSVPGQSAEVERYKAVKVEYLDYNGQKQVLERDDFLAIAMQHEFDHLDGILYIDRISRLKRQMLLKKLQKFRSERDN